MPEKCPPTDGPSIDDIPLEELGDRLCEHAAHIAAATYRWLRLLAAFDRRNGWAHWGCRSCAHWLNWRCGLDLRSAREKVRVAHALTDLPLVSEAFSRGEISYSKVRAITRIATDATEETLLGWALHGTTQHIEKIVRGYRRCLPADDPEVSYERRYVDWRYEEDGTASMRVRLRPEELKLVLRAMEKLMDEASAVRSASRENEGGSAEPQDRVDALVGMARRELAGHKAAGSSADRYTVMVHVDAGALAGGNGVCHVEDGPRLAPETVRRLMCDASIVPVVEDGEGNPLNVGRKTRTIPAALRRALKVRDGGCTFPGCPHKAFVDAHHVKPWSMGGETSLRNLVLLCSFHHRLVHEGQLRMGAEPDGRFTFVMQSGRVLETAALSVEPGGVERANAELGLRIDPMTPVPQWYGDPWDLGVAVWGLLRMDGLGEPAALMRFS